MNRSPQTVAKVEWDRGRRRMLFTFKDGSKSYITQELYEAILSGYITNTELDWMAFFIKENDYKFLWKTA